MEGPRKDWLVRTKTGEILGPFTQAELYDELNRKHFSPEDEIAPSGGYWISAQALFYREGDDFTHTSTRSQYSAPITGPITSSITGPTDPQPPPPARDEELTPTPEFKRPDVVPASPPPVEPKLTPVKRHPSVLRIVLAVVAIFLMWAITLHLRAKPTPPAPQPVAPKTGNPDSDSAFLRQIYQQIHAGQRKEALRALTAYHETPAARNDLEYLVPYGALLITEQESLDRARRLLRQVAHSSQVKETVRGEALMWLGYSHLMQDRDAEDRAEGYFLESLQLNPKSPATRYNLGRAYLKKGKYLEALDYLQLAELEVPELWLVHIHKGNARARLGQREEARKALRTALERAPDRWYPYMVLAAFLSRNGETENAQSVLRAMFTRDPQFEVLSPAPFGYYQEEVNYPEYQGAFQVAMADAIPEDREYGQIYLSYLNGFSTEDGANEMKRLERLADKGHFPARILSLKISVDHFVDEATLNARLARVPADVKKFGAYAYVIRGEAKLRLNKTEEAISEFQQALAVDGRSAAAHLAVARAFTKSGRRRDAQDHLDKLLTLHPDYIPALNY